MLANKTLINGLYVGCIYSKACFCTENTILLPITMENVRYCQRVLFFRMDLFCSPMYVLLKQPKEKQSFLPQTLKNINLASVWYVPWGVETFVLLIIF